MPWKSTRPWLPIRPSGGPPGTTIGPTRPCGGPRRPGGRLASRMSLTPNTGGYPTPGQPRCAGTNAMRHWCWPSRPMYGVGSTAK